MDEEDIPQQDLSEWSQL